MRGDIVAFALDADGTVGLRYRSGMGLLRTRDGVPRPAIAHDEIEDVATLLSCIAEDLGDEGCRARGVEVEA